VWTLNASETGLDSRAKQVIEFAEDEARRLGGSQIDCEHLLLGVLREGQSIAASVLMALGMSLDNVRAETMRILSQEVST
jgi:ATP-dependent Clp protease ATP-binding subunit ClpC